MSRIIRACPLSFEFPGAHGLVELEPTAAHDQSSISASPLVILRTSFASRRCIRYPTRPSTIADGNMGATHSQFPYLARRYRLIIFVRRQDEFLISEFRLNHLVQLEPQLRGRRVWSRVALVLSLSVHQGSGPRGEAGGGMPAVPMK